MQRTSLRVRAFDRASRSDTLLPIQASDTSFRPTIEAHQDRLTMHHHAAVTPVPKGRAIEVRGHRAVLRPIGDPREAHTRSATPSQRGLSQTIRGCSRFIRAIYASDQPSTVCCRLLPAESGPSAERLARAWIMVPSVSTVSANVALRWTRAQRLMLCFGRRHSYSTESVLSH